MSSCCSIISDAEIPKWSVFEPSGVLDSSGIEIANDDTADACEDRLGAEGVIYKQALGWFECSSRCLHGQIEVNVWEREVLLMAMKMFTEYQSRI